MLHKSYVSKVVDPFSDYQANWHGSPDHGSDQLLDLTGLGHQHWITAERGVIETLTLDPMTGISYPLVSCLLHTKTGQHSLPPLYTDHRNSAKVYSTQPMEFLLLIPVMVRMAPRPTRLHTAHHLSLYYPMLMRMCDCKTPTRFSQICRRSSAYIPLLR